MPYKANADRRHRIPKQRHRVTNWPSYEAGLLARGSLTVWFTAEAIEAWGAEPALAVVVSPATPPWRSPQS
jgi:hypothetical protein